jgi:hypothetical protein
MNWMIWYPAITAKEASGVATKRDTQYANSVPAMP